MTTLTDRQLREKDYYNQFAQGFDLESLKVDLSPVLGPLSGNEARPWNSYWSMYSCAVEEYTEGAKILDFGSGPGENALRFARIGYEVQGFDISEANVELAKKLFQKHNANGDFCVSSAEALPYKDNSFELIAGIDILHHIDIPKGLAECKRVLKPGGKAFFREPVEAPLLDSIRNTWPLILIAPKQASFELHITEDERKLNHFDEEEIQRIFPKLKKRPYLLFARLDRFIRRDNNPNPSFLEKLDHKLFQAFPFLQKFCGAVIYEVEK